MCLDLRYLFLLACVLYIGGISSGCGQQHTEGGSEGPPSSGLLSPELFQEKSQKGQVLDVRTPEEYGLGYIKGAQLMNFFDTSFKDRLEKLEKGKSYFVYCAKGGRSAKAKAIMEEMGFTEVYDLKGGFGAWKAAGLPSVRSGLRSGN